MTYIVILMSFQTFSSINYGIPKVVGSISTVTTHIFSLPGVDIDS